MPATRSHTAEAAPTDDLLRAERELPVRMGPCAACPGEPASSHTERGSQPQDKDNLRGNLNVRRGHNIRSKDNTSKPSTPPNSGNAWVTAVQPATTAGEPD